MFSNFSSAELINLASLPLIAAIIGWFTNYIAVKMIFRPRLPYRFLGFTIQGLIPRRQRELAEKIAATVETHLISNKDVANAIRSGSTEKEIIDFIEVKIALLLKEKAASIPLIGMFIGGEVTDKINETIRNELRIAMPELIDRLLNSLDDSLDFREIVRQKVMEFELNQLESIIYEISATELKTIELLGGVLGFFVGLVQAAIFVLSR